MSPDPIANAVLSAPTVVRATYFNPFSGMVYFLPALILSATASAKGSNFARLAGVAVPVTSTGSHINSQPLASANFRSDDSIGELAGVSGDTIRNYISLTNLIPELMEMVDEKKIALSPAYQIAALPQESQNLLYDTIESEQATPSLSQAQRIRKLSQSGKLNEDSMLQIMMEQKKPERNDITLSGEKLRKYFPRSYSPQRIEETIFKLLDAWMRKRQRDNSR